MLGDVAAVQKTSALSAAIVLSSRTCVTSENVQADLMIEWSKHEKPLVPRGFFWSGEIIFQFFFLAFLAPLALLAQSEALIGENPLSTASPSPCHRWQR